MPNLRVTISKRYCLIAIIVCIVVSVQFTPLLSQALVFLADFETTSGDNAWTEEISSSDGSFIIGVPSPYQSNGIQLEIPASGGTQSLVTGTNPGQDLDGNNTRFHSPDFTLPNESLTLSFDYYFAYDTDATNRDDLRIEIRRSSNNVLLRRFIFDSGSSTGRAASWTQVIDDISVFAGETVYFMIHARDRDNDSQIEAALDNVTVSYLNESISGVVYVDVDDDGVLDNGELGLSDITVSLFDQGALVQQTTTDTDGLYSFDAIDPTISYHIIFEGWEGIYSVSSLGPDNKGDIQLGQGGQVINFGLADVDMTCDDPYLIIPCYVEGAFSSIGDETSLVRVLSSADGHDFIGATPTADYEAMELATYRQLGTVYGIAYDHERRHLYASAFHKRYTDFGPAGQDGIYQLDIEGNVVGILELDNLTSVNDVAGPDVHDFSSSFNGSLLDIGLNNASFDGVGKLSLGDIDIDEENGHLYVVNLFDRIIYSIDVSSGSSNQASLINSWPTPDETGAGRHRPFALAWYDQKLWVGSVDENGSSAYVHSLDPASGSFALELTVPLNYPRQAFFGVASNPNAPGNWNPWLSDINDPIFIVNQETAFPQAMLTDIEFDVEGSMILGFRDRFGDQSGPDKYYRPGDAQRTWSIAQGDLLKACFSDNANTPIIQQQVIAVELENLAGQSSFSPFEVMNDPSASNGQYIVWPDNSGPLIGNPTDNTPGQVIIDFTTSDIADIEFAINVNFPNGGDNSFWYKLDDGPWQVQNSGSTNGWEQIVPTTFSNVSTGDHTLRILRREDGSELDRVELSVSDGFISSGLQLSILDVELEALSNQPEFAPFEVVNDATASNGQYIVWPNNNNPIFNNPTDGAEGQVAIEFELSETANVSFEIRVDFDGTNNNSFWYKIDNGSWQVQNSVVTNGWEEIQVTTIPNLPAGMHTLSILRREDGSQLDKVSLSASSGTITGAQMSSSGFVLESGLGGSCPVNNTGLSNSGPGGKEFYYWDIYSLEGIPWNPAVDNGAFHWEVTQGGLAQVEGAPFIITTASDPIDDFSGGFLKFNNTSGAREGGPLTGPVNVDDLTGGYTIYESGDFISALPASNGTAGKANGLGDIEAACNSLHAIGNYVWYDEDQDGIQDNNELPLAGVEVELYKDGVLFGVDTTDQEGYYFFGGSADHGLIDDNVLQTDDGYELRVSLASAQANTSGINMIHSVTIADVGNDTLDSDASFVQDYALILVDLDPDVYTDYTLDFGFNACGMVANDYLEDIEVCQRAVTQISVPLGPAASGHSWTELPGTTSSGYVLSGINDSILTIDAISASPGIVVLLHQAELSGCPVQDSLIVSIIAEPEVIIISSADTICELDTIKLTAEWEYDVNPIEGFVPPSNGQGVVLQHDIFNIRDPSSTELVITLPIWDDHFAQTVLNGKEIFPRVLEPNSWNAGGMDIESPWLPNVNGLPRSIIRITESSVRYFRTATVNSTELEEVFPSNWVTTPQPFIIGDNTLQFGILNTAGPVGGSWTIEAFATNGFDYLWSTGDTTMMITAAPTETTEYMVTVTNSFGCTFVAERTIYAGVDNTESITYDGCSGDGYEVEVGGNIYNEANPTDTLVRSTQSGCDSIFHVNLTFRLPPIVEAGTPSGPLCSDKTLLLMDLGASITGGITTGFWTSTNGGTFNNQGNYGGPTPATEYTPSQAEIDAGKIILTLTSDDPVGSCEPEADAVMILINDVRCNTFPWSGG